MAFCITSFVNTSSTPYLFFFVGIWPFFFSYTVDF